MTTGTFDEPNIDFFNAGNGESYEGHTPLGVAFEPLHLVYHRTPDSKADALTIKPSRTRYDELTDKASIDAYLTATGRSFYKGKWTHASNHPISDPHRKLGLGTYCENILTVFDKVVSQVGDTHTIARLADVLLQDAANSHDTHANNDLQKFPDRHGQDLGARQNIIDGTAHDYARPQGSGDYPAEVQAGLKAAAKAIGDDIDNSALVQVLVLLRIMARNATAIIRSDSHLQASQLSAGLMQFLTNELDSGNSRIGSVIIGRDSTAASHILQAVSRYVAMNYVDLITINTDRTDNQIGVSRKIEDPDDIELRALLEGDALSLAGGAQGEAHAGAVGAEHDPCEICNTHLLDSDVVKRLRNGEIFSHIAVD